MTLGYTVNFNLISSCLVQGVNFQSYIYIIRVSNIYAASLSLTWHQVGLFFISSVENKLCVCLYVKGRLMIVNAEGVNKRYGVRITGHGGAFVRPLLLWKIGKNYIL
jgi:uncharacterized membrane protein